jgi:RNA polymerase sigma-70 factor, ECF subfamily
MVGRHGPMVIRGPFVRQSYRGREKRSLGPEGRELNDWAAIVREHGGMAFETAWRILGNACDAEDAVQEAFLHALRLHRQETVDNWGALLRHLASCRALDLLRKRGKVVPLATEPLAPRSSQPDAVAIASEGAALLREALARLSEREAEVFSLYYFGDLTNPEIAEVLKITVGAVAVALHKARTRIKAMLQPSEE